MNNKLAEYKDNIIQLESDEHPRRGSRGSILSGKANVEPETSQTTIPAHHLAKLSLSTSQDYVRICILLFIQLLKFYRILMTAVLVTLQQMKNLLHLLDIVLVEHILDVE